MTTTPNDIIKLALKDSGVIGIGQTPSAEDTNDAFTRLNWMLAQWSKKRWLVYHLLDIAFTSTGALSYTVGVGQQFNVKRPDRLEGAYFRQLIQSQPNQIDYPLELIESRETYSQIALKQLVSFPNYIFYDSAYPVGFVYPWPLPQANIYEVHILVKETLTQFTSLSQSIILPDEYYAALFYNLCARLRPAYQMPPDQTVVALAKDALGVIRGSNTQIPRLVLPTDLVRPGIYNVYSDQVR